jgi:hypothetical protein
MYSLVFYKMFQSQFCSSFQLNKHPWVRCSSLLLPARPDSPRGSSTLCLDTVPLLEPQSQITWTSTRFLFRLAWLWRLSFTCSTKSWFSWSKCSKKSGWHKNANCSTHFAKNWSNPVGLFGVDQFHSSSDQECRPIAFRAVAIWPVNLDS